MTNIVLLGGNGYLGRELSKQWLARNPQAALYIVSRSGNNQFQNSQVYNLKADVTDFNAVNALLPDQVDYIVDLIGAPAKDPQQLININQKPADVMQKIAEQKQVKSMGIIGGILGPKSFVTIKAKLIRQLKQSTIPLAYVEPTLVYGAGRSDSMAKMVPLLKFFGIFSRKLKPVTVTSVV
ncbi:NAD-dependent epimerase/dehydratase family protein [Lapidilactobacillus bayanensis]|uniref:NAD-dependent epimerase/dehydratase family protein n=1 Tax=Lapidilactobacillus bayanensis TaxID=2485998 RepID=UPI000F768256|nr:NAD-dependent epimerase/dehydratase family protein [Lapidilactobacillus bayanensis]